MNLLLDQWQRLPETEVRRLQAEKLRHYLRTVVLPFSPHYRRCFQELGLTSDSVRAMEDLEKIPFASKMDRSWAKSGAATREATTKTVALPKTRT